MLTIRPSVLKISLLLLTLLVTNCTKLPDDNGNEERQSIDHRRIVSPFPSSAPSVESTERMPMLPRSAKQEPTSTFSIDVDTASYTRAREQINNSQVPAKSNIRIEEFINYFSYDYAPPSAVAEHPIAVYTEVGQAAWDSNKKLVKIGLKGKELQMAERRDSNFVFLIDTSGSMSDTLPIVKESLARLVDKLTERDHIAIVTYAGTSEVILPSANGEQKKDINEAIKRLGSGGGTNGSGGINAAYEIAQQNFISGGVNRVILATDGDFNVGVTSQKALEELISAKAKDGVDLTVIGVGQSLYGDDVMETLASKGNGNYAHIDTLETADKIFGLELTGTLETIAKDVKVQVTFNGDVVESYRLIGYVNRHLDNEDFSDDKKDAGDMGAGHAVTALYEIALVEGVKAGKVLDIDLRYKLPDTQDSKLVKGEASVLEEGSEPSLDFNFASAVAAFGMKLEEQEAVQNFSYAAIAAQVEENLGADHEGYRKEFLGLVKKVEGLSEERITLQVTGSY